MTAPTQSAPSARLSLARSADRSGIVEERVAFGAAEIGLICASFGLLVLTCIDVQPVRDLAVITWLVSFTILILRNIGAAIGVYVSAVALYSTLFSGGTFSLFERPDHPALLMLLGSLVLLRAKGVPRLDWLVAVIIAFLAYGLMNGVQTGTLSSRNIAQFARTFGIPLVLCVLVTNARGSRKDLMSFFLVMFALAFYSAVVSVLWQFEALRDLIFPRWIVQPDVNQWADSIRAGGLLMQPAWNGLLLTLVFCMCYFAYHRWVFGPGRVLLLIVGGAILLGIYLTYTRGVYLGALCAVTALFWMRTRGDGNVAARRLALIFVAVLGIGLAFLTRPSTLEGRIGKAETAIWRIEIWKVAFDMIPSRPIFGFGFQGYGSNAYKYMGESEILLREHIQERQPAVHNTFLNILVEMGLVGFGLYVAVHLLIFMRAARRASERWGRQGAMWVLVFMASFFIAAQFAVAQEPTTTTSFYGCLGLIAGLPALTRHQRLASGPQRLISPRPSAGRAEH